MFTVSGLYIYPVKSLGGFSVSEAVITPTGFQYDRRWMLVDKEADGLGGAVRGGEAVARDVGGGAGFSRGRNRLVRLSPVGAGGGNSRCGGHRASALGKN